MGFLLLLQPLVGVHELLLGLVEVVLELLHLLLQLADLLLGLETTWFTRVRMRY